MTEQLTKAQRLQNDLVHLGREMNLLATTTHAPGSPALQYARYQFRELEATYHSKVGELAKLGESPSPTLTEQVGRAASHLARPEARRCLLPAPSAVGGKRFVEEVWVSPDMMLAFLDALDEIDGHVLSQRVSGRYPNSPIYYTVSVATARDLFQLGSFMMLCHQTARPEEGGYRG